MTHRTHILTAALAALSLTACGKAEPEKVGGPAQDKIAQEAAARPKVALPPSIKSSKTYRCKDKSVVYVNFLTDDVSVNVRDKEESPPAVTLRAPAAGEPFVPIDQVGEGFKMVGSGDEITYTSPESGTQVCKA